MPGFARAIGGGCAPVDGERGLGLNFRVRLNKMPARPKLPVITRPGPILGLRRSCLRGALTAGLLAGRGRKTLRAFEGKHVLGHVKEFTTTENAQGALGAGAVGSDGAL